MPNVNVSTESLQALLTTYQNAYNTLTETGATMNSTLQNTEWQSPAAEDFRNAWQGQYYPNLQKICEAVDQFNTAIQNQLNRYLANEGLG